MQTLVNAFQLNGEKSAVRSVEKPVARPEPALVEIAGNGSAFQPRPERVIPFEEEDEETLSTF